MHEKMYRRRLWCGALIVVSALIAQGQNVTARTVSRHIVRLHVAAILPQIARPGQMIRVLGAFPEPRPAHLQVQFFGPGVPQFGHVTTWGAHQILIRVPPRLAAGNYWLVFGYADPETGAAVSIVSAPQYVRISGRVLPVVIRRSTIIMTRTTLGHLLLPPATHTLDVSRPNLLLVFNGAVPQLRTIAPGDVIASGPSPIIPYGLLRKVTAVNRQGSLMILSVKPATLDDALTQGTIEIHGTLDASGVNQPRPHVSGEAMPDRPAAVHIGVGRCIDVTNAVLYDGPYGHVGATGRVCLSGGFDLSMVIPPCRLLPVQCGTPIQASFTFAGSENADVHLSANGTLDISKERTVFDYNLCEHDPAFCIVDFLGGFPIEASPELRLIVGVDGHVSVGLTLGVAQSLSVSAGIHCQDAACTPSASASPSMSLDQGYNLSDSVDATVYADPHVTLLLYDVAGPDLEFHSFTHVHINSSATPCWTIDAGLQDLIGLRLTIGKFEWNDSFPWAGITQRIGQGACGFGPKPGPAPGPGPASTPAPPVNPTYLIDTHSPFFTLQGLRGDWTCTTERVQSADGAPVCWTLNNGAAASSDRAIWHYPGSAPAMCDLRIYIPDNYATARLVDYTVTSNGQPHDIYLDQNILTGWQDEGPYLFAPSDSVGLSDWDSADLYHTRFIGADAVQYANCTVPGNNPAPPNGNGYTTTPAVGHLLQLQQETDTRTAPSFSSPAQWQLPPGRIVLIVDTRVAEGATWWDLDDSRNGGGTGWFTYATPPNPTAVPTAPPAATVTDTPLPATVAPSPTIPMPTTTPSSMLPAPFITSSDLPTYQDQVVLAGTRDASLATIYVNANQSSVVYPDGTHWQVPVALAIGLNTFTVYGRDSQGNQSSTASVTIDRHILGDINGDGRVNLTDLSILSADFGKPVTDPSVNPLSDLNGDGTVGQDDVDLMKANWTG